MNICLIQAQYVARESSSVVLVFLNGIGYEVVDHGCLPEEANLPVHVWTSTSKDGEVTLFGFANKEGRELARLIASAVNGVGPRLASRLVGVHGYAQCVELICGRNAKGMANGVTGLSATRATDIINAVLKAKPDLAVEAVGANEERVAAALRAVIGKVDPAILREAVNETGGKDTQLVVNCYIEKLQQQCKPS